MICKPHFHAIFKRFASDPQVIRQRLPDDFQAALRVKVGSNVWLPPVASRSSELEHLPQLEVRKWQTNSDAVPSEPPSEHLW